MGDDEIDTLLTLAEALIPIRRILCVAVVDATGLKSTLFLVAEKGFSGCLLCLEDKFGTETVASWFEKDQVLTKGMIRQNLAINVNVWLATWLDAHVKLDEDDVECMHGRACGRDDSFWTREYQRFGGEDLVDVCLGKGLYDSVCWLVERNLLVAWHVVHSFDLCVGSGNLKLVKYVVEKFRLKERASDKARLVLVLLAACESGNRELVEYIQSDFFLSVAAGLHFENEMVHMMYAACVSRAACGSRDLFVWLAKKYGATRDDAIKQFDGKSKDSKILQRACETGNLAIVEWMHETWSFKLKDLAIGGFAAFKQACINAPTLDVANWLIEKFRLREVFRGTKKYSQVPRQIAEFILRFCNRRCYRKQSTRFRKHGQIANLEEPRHTFSERQIENANRVHWVCETFSLVESHIEACLRKEKRK